MSDLTFYLVATNSSMASDWIKSLPSYEKIWGFPLTPPQMWYLPTTSSLLRFRKSEVSITHVRLIFPPQSVAALPLLSSWLTELVLRGQMLSTDGITLSIWSVVKWGRLERKYEPVTNPTSGLRQHQTCHSQWNSNLWENAIPKSDLIICFRTWKRSVSW